MSCFLFLYLNKTTLKPGWEMKQNETKQENFYTDITI